MNGEVCKKNKLKLRQFNGPPIVTHRLGVRTGNEKRLFDEMVITGAIISHQNKNQAKIRIKAN